MEETNKLKYYALNFFLSGGSAVAGGIVTHPIDTAKV